MSRMQFLHELFNFCAKITELSYNDFFLIEFTNELRSVSNEQLAKLRENSIKIIYISYETKSLMLEFT